jgi:DNA-binding MarR family transcriptional regulator
MGDKGREVSYLWDEFKKTSSKGGNKTENSVEEPKKSQEVTTVAQEDLSENRLIATEEIKGRDPNHSVKIKVYKTGESEEIKGEYIIKRSKLKFVLSYGKLEVGCEDDCGEAVSAIASATGYKVTKTLLNVKLNELRKAYTKEEQINVVDYVRNKYSYQIEKIEKDPFGWVLEKTNYIVGYDRLKILAFLSVVSSRLDRVAGMSRLHVLFVGKSGAGKSTTVKSVLRFLDGFDIVIWGTRFTQNALGYLNIDTFDNKVVFLEQIDDQNINYLREMMTEERVCTLVTEKVKDEEGNEKLESRLKCTPGQGAVISTSVIENINVYREQLFNRFLKVYVDPYSVGMDKITEAIWERKKDDVGKEDALVFYAYLISRPKFVEVDHLKERAVKFLSPLMGVSREPLTRVTEILRNLVASVASARGKTKADDEDFDFVIRNFQLDVLYNGLGLTERDVEIINVIPDYDVLKTSEIAEKLKMSKNYALNLLKDLERKGVVESEVPDGKVHLWSLTDLGRRVKELMKEVDKKPLELSTTAKNTENDNTKNENVGTANEAPEVEVRTERGVVEIRKNDEIVGLFDVKFREGSDGGRGGGDAVPVNVGRGLSGDEEGAEGNAGADPQFRDFVVGNNGMTLSFFDINASFLNENKTKEFINWCVNNGYCEPVKEGEKEKYLIRADNRLLSMKREEGTGLEGENGNEEVRIYEKVEWKLDEEFTGFLRKCLRDGKCYVDRTADPPVIRITNRDDIEILGWVRFTRDGGLESRGLKVEKHNNMYASYNEKVFSHGTHYLIRENGEEKLVREKDLRDVIWTGNIKNGEPEKEIKVDGVDDEELREVIEIIRSGNYEIDGYVTYIPPMEPEVYGVEGVVFDFGSRSFVFKGKRYPPGIYDRVVSDGKEYLVPHDLLAEL